MTTKIPHQLLQGSVPLSFLGRDGSGKSGELPFAAVQAISGQTIGIEYTSGTELTATAGVRSSADRSVAVTLAAPITKTLTTFAAGAGNGALDIGSVTPTTWYYAFMITNGSDIDMLVSLSRTSPAIPSGYMLINYIGAIKINTSGQLTPFLQQNQYFQWDPITLDYLFSGNAEDSTKTITLNTPPAGKVLALMSLNVATGASMVQYSIYPTGATERPGSLIAQGRGQGNRGCFNSFWSVPLHDSNQVNARQSVGTPYTMVAYTIGWQDQGVLE